MATAGCLYPGPGAMGGGSSSCACASAEGDTATDDGLLAALPLRGCVSEYVQRFGWGGLPSGTDQLLRDILQTLRGMGLQFTLEEQGGPSSVPIGGSSSVPEDNPEDSSCGGHPAAHLEMRSPAEMLPSPPRDALPPPGQSDGDADSFRTQRLTLTIRF